MAGAEDERFIWLSIAIAMTGIIKKNDEGIARTDVGEARRVHD